MPGLHPILAASIREAVRSLQGARLRTLLGLIGIMVGIASVIAMISTAEIAKSESRRQFETLGTDILTIAKLDIIGAFGREPAATIGLNDALDLAEAVPTILEAAPHTVTENVFIFAGKSAGRGLTQGVSESFASVNRLRPAEGRFVSDMDSERNFAVVGSEIAAAIRRLGMTEIVGEILEIEERLFTIVGVLEDAPESFALPFQVKANKSVFVPITTVQRISPEEEIKAIIARAAPGIHHEDASRAVRAYFAERTRRLNLRIVSAEQLIRQMESQIGLMTLLLGAVGSISLIVGGMGVMNVMLTSVTERRREIGIRRAIGATRRYIQYQFLVEAVILTVGGGLIGILVGVVATYGICRFTEWEFYLSSSAVLAGFGVSTVIGIFFGFQPAWQASRLDPIVALQGE